MTKSFLVLPLCLLMLSSLHAASIDVVTNKQHIIMPHALAIKSECLVTTREFVDAQLIHSEGKFYLIHKGILHSIENYNIDRNLVDMTEKELCEALDNGCAITITQQSDGRFTLTAGARLLGGGFIVGKICKYVTKGACYVAVIVVAGITAHKALGDKTTPQTNAQIGVGLGILSQGGKYKEAIQAIEVIGEVADAVGKRITPW